MSVVYVGISMFMLCGIFLRDAKKNLFTTDMASYTPMKQLYPSLVKQNKEFGGVVYKILGKRLLIGEQIAQRQLKAW